MADKPKRPKTTLKNRKVKGLAQPTNKGLQKPPKNM